MSDITAFEALVASDSEGKIAKQAAADKLAAAIYDVREQYGAHLFCAKSKEEFHDRVALCKDDMIKTVNAHLMPVTGVMRKVCKAIEREWQQKIAADSTDPASPGSPMANPTFNTDPGPLYGGPAASTGVVSNDTGLPPSNPTVPNMTDVGMADAVGQGRITSNYHYAYDEDGDFDALVAGGGPAPAPARSGPRPLHEIARDIKRNWPKVNYAAQPYLDALHELESVDDMYYQDPAKHIVNYFLSNAGTWRGPEAKRIKDELKGMVRGASRVAYSDDDLAAYGEMFDNSPVGGQHASQPEGEAEEWHPSHKKADNTGPDMSIDQTYSPSDENLIPEGDFHGYLDSVDQNAPSQVGRNFTPGGDSGKEARRTANEMMGYPSTGGAPAMPDASGMMPTDPNAQPPAPGTAGSGVPGAGSGAVTASIIKRYAQWCVDNLARPSLRTMEYYAANRPDQEYFILTSALQRHAEAPGGGASQGWGFGGWGTPVNPSGGGSTPDPQPLDIEPAMGGMGGMTNGGVQSLIPNASAHMGSRRTAAGKDYLQQADEAITNLLNEKAEEFQESIQPLQQALQTIQYAEQVQQAQNPMSVMPPAGTVNVLPQTQGPQGPAPQGVDPSTGQIDPAILQQLMGMGGMDPSAMAGGAQGGPPPAAAAQGALPPEIAQQMQMQARRRHTASQVSDLIAEYEQTGPDDVRSYELEDALHHLAEQGDPEAIAYLEGHHAQFHQGAVSELGYDWPADDDESEYHPDPRSAEEWQGKPKSKKDAGRRGGYPKG